MKKVIVAIIIMLLSAYIGAVIGSYINGPETTAIIFTIVSGFAYTIYTIEKNKDN